MVCQYHVQSMHSTPTASCCRDGWGSYHERLTNTPVFQGCYKTARKFYALFQLHTTPERAAEDGVRACAAD
eukprot:scaffold97666_cov17-Tisochrysis_lutea.AAC.1